MPIVTVNGIPVDKKGEEIRALRAQLSAIGKERDDLTGALQKEIDALKREIVDLKKKQSSLSPTLKFQEPPEFDRKRPCFVELGRYGDIINILPIVRDKFIESGIKPVVVVSRGFEDLFDGVSYADALPLQLKTTEILPAIDEANVRFDEVIVTQIYGIKYDPGKQTKSYNRESWRIGGYLDRWDDPDMRLVFDRRNYARERQCINSLFGRSDKPVVLINLVGNSSPFDGRDRFRARMFSRWQDQVNFVDISEFKAARLFDLVGLIELSDAVITTDTSTLHLPSATKTQVIALLSDGGGWRQTEPRCNTVLSFTASEWEKRADEIDTSILSFIDGHRTRGITHAFERHDNNDPRIAMAQSTWGKNGWNLCPYENYTRDARSIGDKRDLPFLRDVLSNALQSCRHGDYVVLTNDDNGIAEDADYEVRRVLSRAVMATGRRFDPDDPNHVGRDLIAFRSDWLRHNFNLVPDFILGAPHWDLWAAAFARKLCGFKWSEKTSHIHCDACEIRAGAVMHEAHKSYWSENQSDPSAKHNENLRRTSI